MGKNLQFHRVSLIKGYQSLNFKNYNAKIRSVHKHILLWVNSVGLLVIEIDESSCRGGGNEVWTFIGVGRVESIHIRNIKAILLLDGDVKCTFNSFSAIKQIFVIF